MSKKVRINDRSIEQIKSSLNDDLSPMIRNVGHEIIEVLKYISKIEMNLSSSKRVVEDKGFLNSLKVYVVIRLVTALETTCRTAFVLSIDDYHKVFDSTIETSFNNLKIINDEENITLGKIVASSLNFQKFESSDKELDIFKIFSRVFNVDFFAELVEDDSGIPQYRQTIEELINERHRLVHEVSSTDWGTQKLFDVFFDVFKFITSFGKVLTKNK